MNFAWCDPRDNSGTLSEDPKMMFVMPAAEKHGINLCLLRSAEGNILNFFGGKTHCLMDEFP